MSINYPMQDNKKQRHYATTLYPKRKIGIFIRILSIVNQDKSKDRCEKESD